MTSEKIRQQKMKYQKSEKGRVKHNEAHTRWKKKNEKCRRAVQKKKAVEYKGGKCSVCGYSKCLASFDFHHLDPKTKNKEIGNILDGTWSTIRTELDKCILLCSNCHRELHWGHSNE